MNEQEKNVVTTETAQPEKKSNTVKILLAVIVIAIIIIIILLLRGCSGTGGTGTGEVKTPVNPFANLTVDENTEYGEREQKSHEEIVAELNKQVEDGMINISMNIYPVFENGTAKGDLLIVNNEINKYPQVVEIYRKDTNELIYQSGVIPVGGRVDYAELSVDLDPGTYNCVAYFNAVNPETYAPLGKAGAEIQITVVN